MCLHIAKYLNIKLLTFVCITLFFSIFSNAQEKELSVDSLKLELKKINTLPYSITNDTLKITILENLVENIYEDETWIKYNYLIQTLTKELLNSKNNKIRLKAELSYALSLNNEGIYETNKGENLKAKKLFFKSQKILEKLNEKAHVATTLNNIGYVYKSEGNLVKALDYYLKSLKIRETINDESGKAMSLNNIGLIYDAQGNKKVAKEYFLKSYKFLEKNGDKYQLSSTLNNLAIIYSSEHNFEKAIDLYNRSKSLQLDIGDKNGEASTYVNMGTVYQSMKKNDTAIDYYRKGLKIFKKINAADGISWAYINLGNIFLEMKKYKLSKIYLDSSSIYANKLKQPELIQRVEKYYYQLDSTQKNFIGAFEHYKKYIFYRDGISNKESEQKNIQQQLNYEFDKKEAVLKEQQLKEKIITEEKSRKQRMIIWVVVVILVIVFFFTVFVLKTLKTTKRQKKIIEKQKEIVEVKQKEIVDSITYANRLQRAILPSTEFISKNLPNSFIFYKPKDIVAGDFYWSEQIDNLFFIAAADSTGHGVPGAMVSVVCSNALNRSLKEFKLTNTGKILDKTRELVIETFEKSDREVKDGMDISLLCIDFKNKKIFWSGANNPIWYIHNNEFNEIKADKQPIGKTDNPKPFFCHEIEYKQNTTFYLFTDGFADQFGGEKGKKFKYKPFSNLLLNNINKPMKQQAEIINEVFNNWKNDLEQVDDVCVIGVCI